VPTLRQALGHADTGGAQKTAEAQAPAAGLAVFGAAGQASTSEVSWLTFGSRESTMLDDAFWAAFSDNLFPAGGLV
jgi:hypothetical protein